MKFILLTLLLSVTITLTAVGQSNYADQFVSVRDLEKLITFEKSELSDYLLKNEFIFDRDKEHFIRDNEDDFILITFSPSRYRKLTFQNITEERYLKIKNSLAAQGYTYLHPAGSEAHYQKGRYSIRIITEEVAGYLFELVMK
ncbi:hypothetical protein DYBT9275_05453 [Dyadobacter sp. CECT 9275]|uniref:Uncharacterized protein n=1 Tax=Dyadobacter helix TaxID=2822344 RepID=A0A916JJE0_9BACT|nr:hypothetical protein [Dyadobacter sp. CECT 9275]CAG5015975.1 hypothetical protein DYBT9275_05453 [Dyadobacter sp. CECT 9275]